MALLADFLIALSLLQLVALFFGLRGVSLTGTLVGPGAILSFLLLTGGVWLALDLPLGDLLLMFVPALLLAVTTLVIVGGVLNLARNPSREFLAATDQGWIAQTVQIPVTLVHVAQGVASAVHQMPATFITPKSWEQGGAAVLVVCGAGDTRTSFKWLLFRELLERGLAVLTIDPPGHGDFVHTPMTVANARVACQAALDWLCAQPGVQRVGALGISFGGNQVAALAAVDQRIRAVALISTPVKLEPLTRRVYNLEAASLLIWPRNLVVLREGSVLTLWREWKSLKGAWYAESLYDMVAGLDSLSAVRAIGPRPILFVHGTRDIAIPPRNAQQLYEAAQGERELLLVRQGTHVSPILYPVEVNHIADWFARYLTRTS